jgi:hypothetical protein
MKTAQELYNERLNRLKTAIALEKPDRIPVCIAADVFLLKYADPSAKASDFIERPEWANETALKGLIKLGDVDSGYTGGYPPIVAPTWLSRVKLPGRDLPDDALWQIEEPGIMTEEDYDFIINEGWQTFFADFIFGRLGYPDDFFPKAIMIAAKAGRESSEAGFVPLMPVQGGPPFDMLWAARGMLKFPRDMRKIPEKIINACDVIMADLLEMIRQQIRAIKPLGVMVGGVRGGDLFVSRKDFERFVWPHTRQMAEVVIEEGAVPVFHIDSKWDDRLEYFRELPKGKCIFDPDSTTDIFKIKEVLGDMMCITGDLPPAMSVLGTPDEVYSYCKRLISEIGPSGFIMSTGCTIPPNAKPENIEAMVASVHE